MTSPVRELWVNILHSSGAKAYTMLLGVFTLFLTARLLGPEGRGQVAVITTWVSMVGTFFYLSLGQVALRRMVADPERHRFGYLFGSLLAMAAMLSASGWLVAIGLYFLNSQSAFKGLPLSALIVGFVALPFFIWEQYSSSLLMGLEQTQIYNRYQVIGRSIAVLAVFALVGGLHFGVTGALGASLLGQMVVALGGAGFLFSISQKNGQICKPDRAEIKVLLRGAATLHLNAIGTFLFTSVNILILNHYYGAEQTGHFQLAVQLLGVLMIFPQAASMVLYGKVAVLGPNGAWPINRRLLLQITLGMISLSVIAALLAPWGIVLLAGEAFQPAVALFQLMLLTLIGTTFSTIMAPQWIGRGYFWQASSITFLVGTVNLTANFWLIPEHGMWGAIYALLVTYAISIMVNGVMAFHCQQSYASAK